MNVRLRVGHADTEQLLRRYIERRLQFALGRFGGRVGTIDVYVHGVEGRSGESRCRITTEMLPSGRFSVNERGLDLFAAIDRAAGRVGRIFGRELDRVRKRRVTRESIRLASAA